MSFLLLPFAECCLLVARSFCSCYIPRDNAASLEELFARLYGRRKKRSSNRELPSILLSLCLQHRLSTAAIAINITSHHISPVLNVFSTWVLPTNRDIGADLLSSRTTKLSKQPTNKRTRMPSALQIPNLMRKDSTLLIKAQQLLSRLGLLETKGKPTSSMLADGAILCHTLRLVTRRRRPLRRWSITTSDLLLRQSTVGATTLIADRITSMTFEKKGHASWCIVT